MGYLERGSACELNILNLFENKKQTQLFQLFIEKYPYLDSNMMILKE